MLRPMYMRRLAVLASAAIAIAGCGDSAIDISAAVAASPAVSPAHDRAVGSLGSWPDPSPPVATSCLSLYPAELASNTNAFDGTVTNVQVEESKDSSGDSPATVELDVHETFAGPERRTVTMKTWNFMLPEDPSTVVGLRVLLAAGDTLDLKECGYSRPYDGVEAEIWRQTF